MPWDVPPPPLSGDIDAKTLYAAIGIALTKWGHVEAALAQIFACLVTSQVPEPASRAYGSLQSFRGQKEMIEAAAEAFFFVYPDTIARLKAPLHDLLAEVAGFSSRRNEIAHGVVQENSGNMPYRRGFFGLSAPVIGPVGFVLRASDHATKKTKLEKGGSILTPISYLPDYVYSSAEVLSFASHFDRLRDWASRFPLVILGQWQKEREKTSS
jgi:hypothetical protein